MSARRSGRGSSGTQARKTVIPANTTAIASAHRTGRSARAKKGWRENIVRETEDSGCRVPSVIAQPARAAEGRRESRIRDQPAVPAPGRPSKLAGVVLRPWSAGPIRVILLLTEFLVSIGLTAPQQHSMGLPASRVPGKGVHRRPDSQDKLDDDRTRFRAAASLQLRRTSTSFS